MLERFQKMLQDLKKKKENELMTFSLDTVQDYFKMQDVNKWLKFNAITAEQVRRADRYEQNLQSILKKLYVPSYQQETV